MKTETGTVEFIGEIVEVSDRFQKRDVAIRQDLNGRNGPYQNYIKFQLLQEKVTHIDQFPVGTRVDVSFDLNGRKVVKDGETKYYTNIDAWKIQLAAPVAAAQPPVQQPEAQSPVAGSGSAPQGAVNPNTEVDPLGGDSSGQDDLPF